MRANSNCLRVAFIATAMKAMTTTGFRVCVTLGLLSQVILWGALTMGLVSVFRALAVADGAPQGDVATVSAVLARSMIYANWGKLIGLPGFLLLLLVAMGGPRQARWFRWGGLIASGIQLFLFPLGTVLGGIGLLLFVRRLRKSDEGESSR